MSRPTAAASMPAPSSGTGAMVPLDSGRPGARSTSTAGNSGAHVVDTSLLGLWRHSLRFLRPYHPQFLLFVLTVLVDIAFSLTFYYSTKRLVDAAVAQRAASALIPTVVGLLVFFVLATLGNVGGDYLTASIEARLATGLRLTLLEHLQGLSASFYAHAQLGDLLARFTSDVGVITVGLARVFPTVVRRALQALAALLFLTLLEWRLTLIAVALLALTLLIPRLFVPRVIRAAHHQAQEDAAAAAVAQEYLGGHAVIDAFGLQAVTLSAFRRRLHALERVSVRTGRLSRLLRTTTGVGVTATRFLVILAGVVFIATRGLSVGTLIGYLGVLSVLDQAVFRLVEVLPEWLATASGLRRVEDLLAEQPTVRDVAGATPLPRLAREIRFADVSFGYTAEARSVRAVSFTIAAGHSVAFVGRSGAGKSTILALLLRLYDPLEGTVALDGYDLHTVTRASLRAQLGVVFQESYLFDLSIRENIRLGCPGATDAAVEEAARAAQIHELILTLPQGYDTTVGERGGRLSGGQRQRIALARALIRRPAVLLLDEATSALDPATEAAFNETLRELARTCTVVSVTHRLSTAAAMDRIVVLEQGRVVEQGTHETLVQAGGPYQVLWDQQADFVVSGDGAQARVTLPRLRRLPLFAGIDDAVLTRVAGLFVPQRFEAGQVMVAEGDVGETFYLLVRGTAAVVSTTVDGEEFGIGVLQDGDFFGEIALLRAVPRTATVRARTPCLVLTLTRASFEGLVSGAPQLRSTLERTATARQRETEALRTPRREHNTVESAG